MLQFNEDGQLEPATLNPQVVVTLRLAAEEFQRSMERAAYAMQNFGKELSWMLYVSRTFRSALSDAMKPW